MLPVYPIPEFLNQRRLEQPPIFDPTLYNFSATTHTMHFPLPLILASVITAVSAGELRIQYYSDSSCKNPMTALFPKYDNSCYNFSWPNSNSMNIDRCTFGEKECKCVFFPRRDCKGTVKKVGTRRDNCASNWGTGFASMKCSVRTKIQPI